MPWLRTVPLTVRLARANSSQQRNVVNIRSPSRLWVSNNGLISSLRQSRFQQTYAQGAYVHEQPQPSRFSRISRFIFRFGIYGLGAVLCVTSGALLAVYTEPESMKWKEFISRKAPTAEETLTLYKPADRDSARINETVVSHPIAQALRSNPDFKESRPHAAMPEGMRPSSLSGGTLAGPGRITVPPLVFSEKDGKSLVSIFHLGEQLCGHPGIIHGGLLATLLDEGLARCCFPALPNKVGVTARLKINYLKPAKANHIFVLRAETVEINGRKATVTGYIEQLPLEGEEGEPVKCVEAQALFIEPKNAQYLRYMRNRVESTT